MSEGENKKLSELRVVDLRAELERRGLDKSGNKQVLLERLQKALQGEGKNPESEVFEIADKKPPKRLSTSSSSYQGEDGTAQSETAELTDTPSEEPKETLDSESEKPTESSSLVDLTLEKEEEPAGGQDSPIHLTLAEEENITDDINPETSEQTVDTSSKSNGNDTDKQPQQQGMNAADTSEATKENESGQEDATNNSKSRERDTSSDSPSGAHADEGTRKAPSNPKILWITNVPKNTRANELKHLLSPCGKVVCAKVVVNARFPGSCCFGYVAMGSAEDADSVIQKLNNTEFNGQIIKIDKFENVKADDLNPARKKSAEEKKSTQPQTQATDNKKDDSKPSSNNNDNDNHSAKKGEEKGREEKGDGADRETASDKVEPERRRSLNSDRSSRGRKRSHSREKDRPNRSTSKGAAGHRAGVLTFDKIKEERERQRMRDRERAMREDSRRRHEEAMRLKEMREITRRQRSEAERLEREREKLRMERDRIEREKSELLKLERERQRVEREKLEMEKIELQRSRLRLEEDRRAAVAKRAPAAGGVFPPPGRRDDPPSFEERKRADRHFADPASHTSRGPAPGKKFASASASSSSSKDYKRPNYDKHETFSDKRGRDYDGDRSNPSGVKFERNFNRPSPREPQAAGAPARSTKESRYVDRDRSPHYRSVPDDRDRHISSQSKTSDREHHSYSESNGRFERGGTSWNHQTPPQSKSFTSGSGQKPWSKPGWRSDAVGSERWSSGATGSSRTSLNAPFSGGNSSLAPACPPPPGINNYSDRFDYNKSSSMRKY